MAVTAAGAATVRSGRRPRPRPAPVAPKAGDFPLWPSTATVALHEAAPADATADTGPEAARDTAPEARHEAAYGSGLQETHGAGHQPVYEAGLQETHEVEHQAAHEAGRTAVLEHLAGHTEQWPPPALREARDARRSAPPPSRPRRLRRTRPPRGPLAGLAAMLLMALLAGFFAWTSAEPFWLDMGHGVRGTARITSCKGSGVLRHCLAEFAAPGREPVDGARFLGLERPPGTALAAEMVPGGRIVYAGHPSGLRVRWAAGLGLVLLCGVALAWLTGAWRFSRLRDRMTAWTLTAAAPLVLGAAIVLASY